jgi:hypothetical protein
MASASTELTLAMLHFVQQTPRPASAFIWTLWPDGRRIARPKLCAILEAMPRPVLVSAHAHAGGITAVSLADVAPDVRAHLEWECRNQIDCLREMLQKVHPRSLPPSVLLELPDGDFVITGEDLLCWAQEYAVTTCGWSLIASPHDARAPVRMLLRHPGGEWSPVYAGDPGLAAT